MVKRRCFVFRALHFSRCNAPLARRPLLRERARSAIISSRAARGRLLGLAVTSGTTSRSPLLLHITPRNARFKRLSGGFLYHIGAVAVAAPGRPGHKKRRRSRRRRFLLMIVDNSRAYPASNVAVSRVNSGFSRGFPSRLGLSRLSQIRCPLTPRVQADSHFLGHIRPQTAGNGFSSLISSSASVYLPCAASLIYP